MTDRIRVRLYDVRFGDAILVTIPDRDDSGGPLERHVLIDVGNVLSGSGGSDGVYDAILRDIADVTGARGIDLYVMTHEHMDHVQGLLYGATRTPPITLPIDTVWLTASADPDYYTSFPEAKRRLDEATAVYVALARNVAAADEPDPKLVTMLDNNNPRKTAHCVEFLRDQLTVADRVHFVHRELDVAESHPFRDARFTILAPEHDTSEYYGRFQPMTLGSGAPLEASALDDARVVPPPGVDTTAFYNLLEARRKGSHTNALAIDQAKNNSSVVFTIGWRGRTLLFSGDAEIRSWQTMQRENVLGPVDFLKVSHHGSHNGTPSGEILDAILPMGTSGDRVAAVSTCLDTYNNVPDDATTKRLTDRGVQVVSTQGVGGWVDVLITEDGAMAIDVHRAPIA